MALVVRYKGVMESDGLGLLFPRSVPCSSTGGRSRIFITGTLAR